MYRNELESRLSLRVFCSVRVTFGQLAIIGWRGVLFFDWHLVHGLDGNGKKAREWAIAPRG
jgi:hypothetical protein